MLQALLADRFQLVLHRDKQEHPGYAIVIGKNGHKPKVVREDDELGFTRVGYFNTFQKMPIAGLVKFSSGESAAARR